MNELNKYVPPIESSVPEIASEVSLPSDQQTTFSMFQKLIGVIVMKGDNTHLKQINNFSVPDLTWEDCEMYMRIRGMPGFGKIPTIQEFVQYQKPISTSSSDTRKGFSAYLANLLTPIVMRS